MASYDLYQNGIPEYLLNHIEIPSIVLFPAKQKHKISVYKDYFYNVRYYNQI